MRLTGFFRKICIFPALPFTRQAFILTLMCFMLIEVRAQGKSEPVEILNADLLTIYTSDSGTVRKMTGNVRIRHDSILLFCDSAQHFSDLNFLRAQSRVKIIVTDTTQITGDELEYDGETKIAELFRNVKMRDGKTILSTDRLTYYRNSGIAVYPQKGIIKDGENTLTSETGFFHTEINTIYFRRNVRLLNPDFRLETDTLGYHTEAKKALFVDDTWIYMKSDTLFTRNGFYNTEAKHVELYDRSWFRDSTYQMCADTLIYDEGNDFGEAMGTVHLFKKDSSLQVFGTCGEFRRKSHESLIYGEPWMVGHMEDDTLHLTARHFMAVQDTLQDSTYIIAWPEVKIMMKSLQGITDSLIYEQKDSILTLMKDPVIWSEENQVSGDTLKIWMKNQNADSMRVMQKCFLISREDTVGFNQVKGKQIYGKFRDNAMYRMLVSGNAESIYFTKNEEKDTYEGMNQSLSNDILMLFEDNKPSRISFITKPEGTFSPMFEVMENTNQLEEFRWRPENRPVKNEILQKLPWRLSRNYLDLTP